MRRARGFTLMETLVVLVIVSLVSAVLLQALAQVYRLQERFGVQLVRSEVGTLQADWIRQLVQGLQPDLPGGPDRFRGDERGFTALATDPFSRQPGVPRPVALSIDTAPGTGAARVRLRMADREISLADWPAPARVSMVYADAKGEPHDRWPPPMGSWPALPQSVQLVVKQGVDEQRVVAVPRTTVQPLPQIDIFGATP